MKIVFWLGLSSVIFGALALDARCAQIYKWVDRDGVIHFSNRPAGGDLPAGKKAGPKSGKKMARVAGGPEQGSQKSEDKGTNEKKRANHQPKLDEIQQLQAEIERLKNAPGGGGN